MSGQSLRVTVNLDGQQHFVGTLWHYFRKGRQSASFGRLNTMSYSIGGSTLESYSFQFDPDGNILKRTSLAGDTNYRYDNASRLIRADYPDGSYEEFSYDEAGNRVEHNLNGDIRTFQYDEANRLTSSSDYLFAYDDNGSLKSRQSISTTTSTAFEYDARNKLVAVRIIV